LTKMLTSRMEQIDWLNDMKNIIMSGYKSFKVKEDLIQLQDQL
jgi:hypothetical protein